MSRPLLSALAYHFFFRIASAALAFTGTIANLPQRGFAVGEPVTVSWNSSVEFAVLTLDYIPGVVSRPPIVLANSLGGTSFIWTPSPAQNSLGPGAPPRFLHIVDRDGGAGEATSGGFSLFQATDPLVGDPLAATPIGVLPGSSPEILSTISKTYSGARAPPRTKKRTSTETGLPVPTSTTMLLASSSSLSTILGISSDSLSSSMLASPSEPSSLSRAGNRTEMPPEGTFTRRPESSGSALAAEGAARKASLTKVGVGVGVPFGVITLVALLALVYCFGRRAATKNNIGKNGVEGGTKAELHAVSTEIRRNELEEQQGSAELEGRRERVELDGKPCEMGELEGTERRKNMVVHELV